ncbi:MAG: ArsR/SmtB family transcription factor [Candidatus Bipolaricaulota bacterium]
MDLTEELTRIERVFKALGNSNRLKILSLVTNHEGICAKEIAQQLELSQPDISYHISKLAEVDIVGREREGTRYCYDLNQKTLQRVGLNPEIFLDLRR